MKKATLADTAKQARDRGCDDCLFFDDDLDLDKGEGFCRVLPPMPKVCEAKQVVVSSETPIVYGCWPIVHFTDWCGAWVEAERQ